MFKSFQYKAPRSMMVFMCFRYRLGRDGKWCEPLDTCLVDNGGCQQTCLTEQDHVRCSCRRGFTLASDLVSCVDLDECAIPDICSHQCRNTWGSYECVCNTGYQLGTDNKSCFSKLSGRQTI